MKKILYLIIPVLVAFSCTELTDLNKNVKDPAFVPGENLFTGAQKNMVDYMSTCNVNRNIWELIVQYWTEVTYTDEANYDLAGRTIPDNFFRCCYRDVLKDLQEADRLIKAQTWVLEPDQKQQTNKLAIIEIFAVYTYAMLVEAFGDVPYSQSLDITILSPKYDDAETVYKDLINRLTVATGQLDVDFESFTIGDNIYQGDVAKWKIFANSLKLRMGMLLADKDPSYAKTTVEAAVTAGVMSSNSDNALFQYAGAQPNTNQLYVELVASGRFDFVAAVTLTAPMDSLNDPRCEFYFTQVDTSTESGVEKLAYLGAEYGTGCTYESFSNQAPAIKRPTLPCSILDYAQVEFLLAEAVERGYAVGGTAQQHYNNGVEASILYWGGSATQVTAYLAQPKVDYLNAKSGATWQEKIGMQAWIAFYLRGFDAWTTQRRLDVPVLVAPPDAISGYPVRYTYPIAEQTLNGDNYRAASDKIGGDFVETRLFFDTKDQ